MFVCLTFVFFFCRLTHKTSASNFTGDFTYCFTGNLRSKQFMTVFGLNRLTIASSFDENVG
jgi:hypothetical protein